MEKAGGFFTSSKSGVIWLKFPKGKTDFGLVITFRGGKYWPIDEQSHTKEQIIELLTGKTGVTWIPVQKVRSVVETYSEEVKIEKAPKPVHKCDCGKVCSSRAGLAAHRRVCPTARGLS